MAKMEKPGEGLPLIFTPVKHFPKDSVRIGKKCAIC